MKNFKKNLQIAQLDKKIKAFDKVSSLVPSQGWVYTTRTTLGMSLSQLGKRMGVSAQSVKEIEQRERSGGVSLKVLKTAAKAFDLKLTYGFSTQNKSLEYIIQKRAEALAKQIVLRTNKTMISEKQANSKVSLRKSIKEQTNEIIANKSKYLWD